MFFLKFTNLIIILFKLNVFALDIHKFNIKEKIEKQVNQLNVTVNDNVDIDIVEYLLNNIGYDIEKAIEIKDELLKQINSLSFQINSIIIIYKNFIRYGKSIYKNTYFDLSFFKDEYKYNQNIVKICISIENKDYLKFFDIFFKKINYFAFKKLVDSKNVKNLNNMDVYTFFENFLFGKITNDLLNKSIIENIEYSNSMIYHDKFSNIILRQFDFFLSNLNQLEIDFNFIYYNLYELHNNHKYKNKEYFDLYNFSQLIIYLKYSTNDYLVKLLNEYNTALETYKYNMFKRYLIIATYHRPLI